MNLWFLFTFQSTSLHSGLMRNPVGVSGAVHPSDEKTKLPLVKTTTGRTTASNAKVAKQQFMFINRTWLVG